MNGSKTKMGMLHQQQSLGEAIRNFGGSVLNADMNGKLVFLIGQETTMVVQPVLTKFW